MCASLQIGAVGWDHEDWQGVFYPSDMPHEWRLTYYANEYRSVLIPEYYWLDDVAPVPSQWLADVPESFEFYCLITKGLFQYRKLAQIDEVIGDLSEKLGGFILDVAPKDITEYSEKVETFGIDKPIFRPRKVGAIDINCYSSNATAHQAGDIGIAKINTSTDHRWLRHFIEQFMSNVAGEYRFLFIEADYLILRDATTMARLLGY